MREPILSWPCPNNKSDHQPLCVDGMSNTVVIEPHYLYIHCLTLSILTGTPVVKLLRNTIYRLQNKLKKMSSEVVRTPQQLMKKAATYLPPKVVDFFRGQISNAMTCKTGRRFGVQERRFALAVYYHSPKAYRFLSSVFTLPSISTLHSWLRKIFVNVGWSKQTLAVLKRKSEVLPKEERLCGIVFDAMSIKEFLHFDQTSDSIIGREDFGEHGKSFKLANHALVFMIKGLIKKWKMVLGYFFYSGGINTCRMRELYDCH